MVYKKKQPSKNKNVKSYSIEEKKDKKRRVFMSIKGGFYSILLLSFGIILLSLFVYFLNKNINIARVNGQAITKTRYFSELHKSSGQQVLDEMITKLIIKQEAERMGVNVSQSDIEEEITKLRSSVESQGSTLEQVLTYQGVTYDQLLENIKIQKMLEAILTDRVSITDDEIKSFYEENKDFYGNEKSFDELYNDIKFQLFQERMTAAYRSWIEEQKAASNIEKYI